ncbi:MAG: hypothetical protein DF168_01407 [Candidatus Moanabacter tarae]|uniref:Uncharacterized protein n=1 Tax=Candidatus Moanibacter tarae TaxID=2200854 RepID=A0A2Z4AFC1_9BACT|nr:MAG: hypothetical protein DF168_01407 [Candidatus Moanabacter tarae]
MRNFLNIGQKLVLNGILRDGEPRHCSDWEVGYMKGDIPGIPLSRIGKSKKPRRTSEDAARMRRALVNVLHSR